MWSCKSIGHQVKKFTRELQGLLKLYIDAKAAYVLMKNCIVRFKIQRKSTQLTISNGALLSKYAKSIKSYKITKKKNISPLTLHQDTLHVLVSTQWFHETILISPYKGDIKYL